MDVSKPFEALCGFCHEHITEKEHSGTNVTDTGVDSHGMIPICARLDIKKRRSRGNTAD